MKLIKAVIFAVGGMLAANASAALILDVQNHANNTPTEYFVDVDSNKTLPPYYRDRNEDWEWLHNGIAGTFTSIILDISAYDVDFASGELDAISVWDGVAFQTLGNLAGANNAWAFTQFNLTGFAWANAQVNAGLRVRIDIDTANAGWLVTLAKAVLTVDDGQGPTGGPTGCNPVPGVPCNPVPEPGSIFLIALGLLGLAARAKARR